MSATRYRDITILHAQDGSQWAQYLIRQLKKTNCDYSIYFVDVEELAYKNPPEIEASVRESHVVFLLVTKSFLEYMENNQDWFPIMLEKRDQELTTIFPVVLCVDKTECLDVCQNFNYKYSSWQIGEIIGTDQSSVIRVMQTVYELLVANKDKLLDTGLYQSPESRICEIFPKKVKTLNQDRMVIVFGDEIGGDITLLFDDDIEPISTDPLNPFCVSFVPPALPSGQHSVRVLLHDEQIEVLAITYCAATEFTSIQFLMQCFGVTTEKELDQVLCSTYQESVCTDEILNRLLKLAPTTENDNANSSSYPTALHWTAAHGLNMITSEMLKSPHAVEMCHTPNCQGRTVPDLAGHWGYEDLRQYIEDFIETDKCVSDVCDLYAHPDQDRFTVDHQEEDTRVSDVEGFYEQADRDIFAGGQQEKDNGISDADDFYEEADRDIFAGGQQEKDNGISDADDFYEEADRDIFTRGNIYKVMAPKDTKDGEPCDDVYEEMSSDPIAAPPPLPYRNRIQSAAKPRVASKRVQKTRAPEVHYSVPPSRDPPPEGHYSVPPSRDRPPEGHYSVPPSRDRPLRSSREAQKIQKAREVHYSVSPSRADPPPEGHYSVPPSRDRPLRSSREAQKIQKAREVHYSVSPSRADPQPKIKSAAVGCRSQNELIDIQEKVKAGVLTQADAEMCFNSWKSRNPHSSISFKEKQTSLHDIQEKYKNTLSLLTNTTKKKLQATMEEENPLHTPVISEPIVKRKGDIGPSGRRHTERTSNTSSRGSNNSLTMRRSNDSGFDACPDFAIYNDQTDNIAPPHPMASANQFGKPVPVSGEDEDKPPLPPRDSKKNTSTTYNKRNY